MAELSIGGTPLANQRIVSADGARAPAVGTDPNSTKQSAGNETTTFQRLSAVEKSSLDVLAELRQKGSELGNVYKEGQKLQNLQGNATAEAIDQNNRSNNIDNSSDKIAREGSDARQRQIEIIAGDTEIEQNKDVVANTLNSNEARQKRLEALAGGESNLQSVEFGPEQALREAELRQSARELEQAILEVSKLASENGEGGQNVAGGNFEGYIANLNALRVAAQSPDANIELARQTREEILQNAQLAALSVRSISADVAQATIE